MKRFILMSLLALSVLLCLEAQLTIDGQIRPRAEFRNGYKKSQTVMGESPEFVVSQRSLIGLSFKNSISGHISFQDVRTWGESAVKKDNPSVLLKEAWIEIPTGKFSFKIGRQILKYDNQRILAATNWNQVGTQHDLLLVKYKNNKFTSHLGLAYNNESASNYFEDYYPVPYYKALGLVWIHFPVAGKADLSLLGVTDLNAVENTKSTYYQRYTFGGNLGLKPVDAFSFHTTFYLQRGKNPTGQKVKAYLWATRATYDVTKASSIFAGTDLISGDDPGNAAATTHKFDILYGSRHKYFGSMDYFPLSQSGIFDGFAGTGFNLAEKYKLEFSLHNFFLPQDYTTTAAPEGKLDPYLGTELDVSLTFNLSKDTQLLFLHGLMFGTSSMDVVKGGTHDKLSNYAVLQLTWTPSFSL